MAITVIINFPNGKTLDIGKYTGINVSRNGRLLDINITNADNDFRLNDTYDEILNNLLIGDDDTFAITLKASESGGAEFSNIVASYYNSGDLEVLHLATKQNIEG